MIAEPLVPPVSTHLGAPNHGPLGHGGAGAPAGCSKLKLDNLFLQW